LASKQYAKVKGSYRQKSIRDRIRALFLDNIGKVVTREQILQVAKDPKTGRVPENWHQRLSELRTDEGYTILSWRNGRGLEVSEYLMPTTEKRKATRRAKIDPETWSKVLEHADNRCEWQEGGERCDLMQGDIDPVGGGTVRLTPDHRKPHSTGEPINPRDPAQWRALCGRHQVMKKNYWDDRTGKVNLYAIVQASSRMEKWKVYQFLKKFFGD